MRFLTLEEKSMNFKRSMISRAVVAAVLGTSLLAGTGVALSQSYGEGGRGPGARAGQLSEADRAQMRERMQARINQRLDRLAARLEIKASQQDAWAAYRSTIGSMFQDRPRRPAKDADAATLMRFRADMAQQRAKHMATLADATAKLQQALEPEQRKVLDEIARNMGARGKRGGPHGRWQHGPQFEHQHG
jgi:hypothetical protein